MNNPGGIRFGAWGLFKTSKPCDKEKEFPPTNKIIAIEPLVARTL